MLSGLIAIIIIAVIVIVLLMILFSFVPVGLWISAVAAGVKVGIGTCRRSCRMRC